MRTPISDFDTLQRNSQARRIGADLYREAAVISPKTVEAVSAVMSSLSAKNLQAELVAEGFAEAMISDSAVRHISSI